MPRSCRCVGARIAPSVVLLSALLASAAHGADKKAPPAAPKTPILTPAQLSACLAKKDKLTRDTDAVVNAKAALAGEKAEIDSSGAALEAQAAALDRTSEEAVNAHNAMVVERNGRVDAYRAHAEAYNADAEAVLNAKDSYQKGCVNRRYDERDLSDLQRKK